MIGLFGVLCALGISANVGAQIHKVIVKPDQILLVKTALGIATIIEAPGAIQSAIIGDQSGFKLEYLDRAVTIKPLRFGAKSNLYLQTEGRRFDLRLETRSQDQADFVIYLNAATPKPTFSWKSADLEAKNGRISLKLVKLGSESGRSAMLDLRLKAFEKIKLAPEQVWVTQGGVSKPIDSLFLSNLSISRNRSAMLGLKLLKSDFDVSKGVEVSIRHEAFTLRLDIPAGVLWQ